MQRIVSVSIGSSKRNKSNPVPFDGKGFLVERIGTDGSLLKAAQWLWQLSLDPSVGALGLGGVDLYVYAGTSRFTFKQVWLLKLAALGRKPVVDGSGLKHTLERRVITQLAEKGIVNFKGAKTLMVCGVDRFGMSEALEQQGAIVTYGDLIFGLNINRVLTSWKAVERLGKQTLWFLTWLPLKWLYPTGEKQTKRESRGSEYFAKAEIIAGDWHFIRRYAPDDLAGKIIITNTLRKEDIEDLFKRGVKLIVTTTPKIGGESFGTNVIEALLVANAGRMLSAEGYTQEISRLGLEPGIHWPKDIS